jgi:hypothetical protein
MWSGEAIQWGDLEERLNEEAIHETSMDNLHIENKKSSCTYMEQIISVIFIFSVLLIFWLLDLDDPVETVPTRVS